MKTIYLLIFTLWFSVESTAQNIILNGSFEFNTASGNTPNLGNSWSSVVSNTWEVDGGLMNLDTSYNCGTASDGNWFVTNCPLCIPSNYLAFSFGLSTPVDSGSTYTLSFDKQSCGDTTGIEIGLSNDSTLNGLIIKTFSGATASGWEHENYIFQSPVTADFITVSINIANPTPGLIALDNFSLTTKPCSAHFTLLADSTPHTWTALNQAAGSPPINYIWNWGDGNSTGGATPSHTYATAGYYDICLTITDSTGCTDTYCDSSTYLNRASSGGGMVTVNVVSTLTAINSFEEEEPGVSIYPNPAQESVTVTGTSASGFIKLEVVNLLGEVLLTEPVAGGIQKEIPLAVLPDGLYMIKLSYAKKQFFKKLIVQHQ